MNDGLPSEIAGDASFDGSEYGWKVAAFPAALAAAERLGFACLGGQFQFRLDGSIFEMYWLDADASERQCNESWPGYVQRACREVKQEFAARLETVDFLREVQDWRHSKLLLGTALIHCRGWSSLPTSLGRKNTPVWDEGVDGCMVECP